MTISSTREALFTRSKRRQYKMYGSCPLRKAPCLSPQVDKVLISTLRKRLGSSPIQDRPYIFLLNDVIPPIPYIFLLNDVIPYIFC